MDVEESGQNQSRAIKVLMFGSDLAQVKSGMVNGGGEIN